MLMSIMDGPDEVDVVKGEQGGGDVLHICALVSHGSATEIHGRQRVGKMRGPAKSYSRRRASDSSSKMSTMRVSRVPDSI